MNSLRTLLSAKVFTEGQQQLALCQDKGSRVRKK
jgi:hypothetical protein